MKITANDAKRNIEKMKEEEALQYEKRKEELEARKLLLKKEAIKQAKEFLQRLEVKIGIESRNKRTEVTDSIHRNDSPELDRCYLGEIDNYLKTQLEKHKFKYESKIESHSIPIFDGSSEMIDSEYGGNTLRMTISWV